MLNRITYILLMCWMLATNCFAQEQEKKWFEAANKAYENEQYDSALVLYKKIEDNGYYAPELFKNIGNCAYKMGNTPEAIYYFEKGLKFKPGDDDLKHNLTLSRKNSIDKDAPQSRTGIGAWISNLIGHTADFWAWWAVAMSVFGGVFLLGYLFIKHNLFKKIGLIGGLVFWIFVIVFTLFSFAQGSQLNSKEYAIIFEPSIDIKNEPSDVSSTAFVLHEGSKVKLLDQNNEWYKISFGKDKVGWVMKEALKVI